MEMHVPRTTKQLVLTSGMHCYRLLEMCTMHATIDIDTAHDVDGEFHRLRVYERCECGGIVPEMIHSTGTDGEFTQRQVAEGESDRSRLVCGDRGGHGMAEVRRMESDK
jgi:hypothetical protein